MSTKVTHSPFRNWVLYHPLATLYLSQAFRLLKTEQTLPTELCVL